MTFTIRISIRKRTDRYQCRAPLVLGWMPFSETMRRSPFGSSLHSFGEPAGARMRYPGLTAPGLSCCLPPIPALHGKAWLDRALPACRFVTENLPTRVGLRTTHLALFACFLPLVTSP